MEKRSYDNAPPPPPQKKKKKIGGVENEDQRPHNTKTKTLKHENEDPRT